MLCPKCQKEETKVIDSRDSDEFIIRRRRECPNCSYRFTTYEKIESSQVMVTKKDETREPFSKEKVLTGISRACTNRPVPQIKLDKLAKEIEQKVNELGKDEVKSKTIGEWVSKKLKKIDEVAYLRFVSVYRSFGSAKTFEKEIKNLNN